MERNLRRRRHRACFLAVWRLLTFRVGGSRATLIEHDLRTEREALERRLQTHGDLYWEREYDKHVPDRRKG